MLRGPTRYREIQNTIYIQLKHKDHRNRTSLEQEWHNITCWKDQPPQEQEWHNPNSWLTVSHPFNTCSPSHVFIHSFNLPPDEPELVYTQLDKIQGQRSLRSITYILFQHTSWSIHRITYNKQYNLVIKHMPSPAHKGAVSFWLNELYYCLMQLTNNNHIGCRFFGGTST